MTKTIGIIGARGYTGAELMKLVDRHPALELAYVSSRKLAGEPVADHVDIDSDLRFEEMTPDDAAERDVDVCVLALPNGMAPRWASNVAAEVVVDLSSDHRFDDSWQYGQPERFRVKIRDARRIANPGCYATGMQLAIGPLASMLAAPPYVFGVSGYSGAGTTPSPRNDPDQLRDNVLPYGLVGHTHEREVTRHLGREVRFTPHVASFFRGITLTVSMELGRAVDRDELVDIYQARFQNEPLVEIVEDAPPLVRDNVGRHDLRIGGFASEGRRVVLVATLDNLLKGAATQAMQNVNLTLGFDELDGIEEA